MNWKTTTPRLSLSQQEPLEGLITNDPQLLKICPPAGKDLSYYRYLHPCWVKSGTGKEVMARAIHQLSPRKTKRFVAINCAAGARGI